MILGLYRAKEVNSMRDSFKREQNLLEGENSHLRNQILRFKANHRELMQEKDEEINTLKGLLVRSEDYTIEKLEQAKKRTKKKRIKKKIDNKIADHVMRKEIYGR